jgi:hypothetical protein
MPITSEAVAPLEMLADLPLLLAIQVPMPV